MEVLHLNQQSTINLYLDLRQCFDLMVEACHNLACHRHGAIDAYLHLHARTHQAMRYFVRHKCGVSSQYNTFAQHPWHGAGQGAADAALRYILLSDTLIDHTKMVPNMMHDPLQLISIQCSLKAFIKDVVLHASSPEFDDLDELQTRAQAQIQWWVQLVKVTGRQLNPTKCCGLIYTWAPDKYGILKLQQHETPRTFCCYRMESQPSPFRSLRTILEHDIWDCTSWLTEAPAPWNNTCGRKRYCTRQHSDECQWTDGKQESCTVRAFSQH